MLAVSGVQTAAQTARSPQLVTLRPEIAFSMRKKLTIRECVPSGSSITRPLTPASHVFQDAPAVLVLIWLDVLVA